MLDSVTKKNIDDCRDVLVGKVPDPKSQIEQITLALIYKFMDDMDREAVEKYSGKAKFFTGEYSNNGWRKLFDPGLAGKDMLDLYSNALDKLQTNPNIPELFRNIFKNAYLPYRDPGTLKLFLKYINEFEYSHSEKLGDAFEYLLSVMGSQGDAGQFRTPRNIIDFVVACVNPQKNETVADVACGTAGFLLSAYKHILKQNTDKRPGDKLTPDQRKKLSSNFMGYDISPDMVRLSLANMYLHGFATPQIYEYDTLSSEDRWTEIFDVILANPPFMTPKGGIRPHKKFGVQANKAEVLFTDYIAEHLSNHGRAGIIVPNGIVATTQTAYKQLRQMLVNDSLIAVVSLPAGCFNPYSGVKTSVLLLDKVLAKRSKHILFIKVENDGFDLGAQRKDIEKNDLPLALEALTAYKISIEEGQPFDEEKYSSVCLLVEKEKVLTNKDMVLSVDRYRVGRLNNSNFPFIKLNDERYFNIESGGTPSSEVPDYWNGGIAWVTLVDLPADNLITPIYKTERTISELGLKKSSTKLLPVHTVLISSRATIGRIAVNEIPLCTNQGFKNFVIKDFEKVNPYYLAYILKNLVKDFNEVGGGGVYKEISKTQIGEFEIPLPPLEIQEQIVKEIEGYQKIIDGAKMVVENYKPTIDIKAEWEMVELGETCIVQSGGTPSKNNKAYWNGNIPWYSSGELNELYTTKPKEYITAEGLNNSNAKMFEKGSLLIGMYDSAAFKMSILDRDATFNQAICGVKVNDKIDLIFLYLYFIMKKDEYLKFRTGARQQNLSKDFIVNIEIPVPPLEEQTEIVQRIEQEQQLVAANKQLISLFEQKIKDKINAVWGKPAARGKAYPLPQEEELRMVAEE